jgi:hypothetical protein
VEAESTFWAGILGGLVFTDDRFTVSQMPPVVVRQGAPGALPSTARLVGRGSPSITFRAGHEVAIRYGARLLQLGDFDAEDGHRVYVDPAAHSFCIGWGHPSREAGAAFVAKPSAQHGESLGVDHFRVEPSDAVVRVA